MATEIIAQQKGVGVMQELPESAYHTIKPHFESGVPGHAFIAAILEGNHCGRIYVDDVVTPSTFLVVPACQFCFVAGRADNPVTNRAIRSLAREQLPLDDGYLLLFPTSAAWEATVPELFADAPERIRAGRLTYDLDVARYHERHAHWRDRLPEDYRVQPYDRSLAEGQGLANLWGSTDRFLDRGFGFAVMHDDTVVSQCHTVFVGDGHAEISIETAASHRRHGFATLATCAFIDHCLATGHTPAWSCWDNNAASQNLAGHMGFVYQGETPAYVIRLA
jgi:RimJ/RimL family protein N-acetyltransferase